jgi:arginase
MEKAPAALRAAGLVERLREAGLTVQDLGDLPPSLYKPDDESPRMRNLPAVLAALNSLRPQVEAAAKTGALVLVLGGECTLALAMLAGLRRYYRSVGLLWMDCDADLNIPATSPSGCVHGMVVAHIAGRGAPELVRFWGEPPLVREPDIVLFGLDRLDPPERAFLDSSPMHRLTAAEIHRMGAAAAADSALAKLHVDSRDFALHFDVDFLAAEDMPACDFPGTTGIRAEATREILRKAVAQRTLLALEVASFNPEKDPDGSAARLLVDLLVDALSHRREVLGELAVSTPPEKKKREAPAPPEEAPSGPPVPEPVAGEAWSSDALAVDVATEPSPETPEPGDALSPVPDSTPAAEDDGVFDESASDSDE